MRILCVIESLEAGGAQRQLIGLATSFKEKGHEVSFLTYYHRPFYLPILTDLKIPYTNIEAVNIWQRVRKMRRYIRQGQYEVVLSFLETPSFICEVAGLPYRKWKLIVGERNANPKILTSLRSKAFRFFHLFADYVVSNSKENLRMVKRVNPLLNGKKCKVIYNMIDVNKWPLSTVSDVEKIEDNLKLIVIGRHVHQKNLIGLALAISKLDHKLRQRIQITWYGDKITPPYYDETYETALKYIEQHQLSEYFSFRAATPDIAKKIQQADVVGLFSFFEGFPNVICEGMACGKPVISSRVSDIPLIVGDPHFTFDPLDPNDIVRVLENILRLDKDSLVKEGEKNRRLALEYFDKEKIANEYLQLMEA